MIHRFLGRYALARQIADARAGQQVTFEGTAEITATPEGALYAETGSMILPDGSRFAAERRYLWREADGRIAVDFHDGRPFHDFDPMRGGLATEHLCGADLYRGGYDFAQWPLWSVTWSVRGPRKNYESLTLYTRC